MATSIFLYTPLQGCGGWWVPSGCNLSILDDWTTSCLFSSSVSIENESWKGAVLVAVAPVSFASIQFNENLITSVQVKDDTVAGIVVTLVLVLGDGAGPDLWHTNTNTKAQTGQWQNLYDMRFGNKVSTLRRWLYFRVGRKTCSILTVVLMDTLVGFQCNFLWGVYWIIAGHCCDVMQCIGGWMEKALAVYILYIVCTNVTGHFYCAC